MATLVRVPGTHAHTLSLRGLPEALVERFIAYDGGADFTPDKAVYTFAGRGDPNANPPSGFAEPGDPHFERTHLTCQRIEADYAPNSQAAVEIFVFFEAPSGRIIPPELTEPRIRFNVGVTTVRWDFDLDGNFIGAPNFVFVTKELQGQPGVFVGINDPKEWQDDTAEIGLNVPIATIEIAVDVPPGPFNPGIASNFVTSVNKVRYLGFEPGVLRYEGFQGEEGEGSTRGARLFGRGHNFRAARMRIINPLTNPPTDTVVNIEHSVFWESEKIIPLAGPPQIKPVRLRQSRIAERLDFNLFLPDPEPGG